MEPMEKDKFEKFELSKIWNLVRKVIWYLFKAVVLDCIQHFKRLHKMMEFDKEANDIAKEMIDEFQKDYMKSGWELISGTSKVIILVSFIGVLLFVNPENPFYGTVIYCTPIMFAFWVFVDKAIDSNDFIRNFSFFIMLTNLLYWNKLYILQLSSIINSQ